MTDLSAEQSECGDKIVDWYNDPNSPQVFRVDGVAGTGKTFMVRRTVDRLNLGLVLFAAFTGKAALVMQQQGCKDASTIHRLIYLPAGSGTSAKSKELLAAKNKQYGDLFDQDENHPDLQDIADEIRLIEQTAASPIFKLNIESPVREADLVVIDECSMVAEDLAKDLLSFNVKILVLGDPGQLPPVFGEGYFMRKPANFTLTQIHRQAAGSPILQLATIARTGGDLRPGVYGNCRVLTKSELTPTLALEASQILCGRNKTRHINNARLRQLRGFGGEIPLPGEKLVCLRNNHDKGLLNGSQWIVVRSSAFSARKVSLTVKPEEGGMPITVLAHAPYFRMYGHTDQEKWWETLQQDEKSVAFDIREAETFTFGDVMTVHKSQGSQWDNVLLLDESSSFGSDARRHLYTGCTRAIKTLNVVKM